MGSANFLFMSVGIFLNLRTPEGPKIEKFQDFAPGLKFSSDQSQLEIFNRD